jgi:uncharacterized protein YggU (UPF0235/DUF167 family)
MKTYKIKLEPTVSLVLEISVKAETKNQAITKCEAHVIKLIANAFGIDPSQCNIKFGDER